MNTTVLPHDLYRSALTSLRAVLPRPLTSNPADTTERDLEAMAQVTALRPANNAEVALAVQFVMAHALAMDIMQVITESPVDALKLWAASANMMRQSRGALSSLLRLQAARVKEARGLERLDATDTQPPPPNPLEDERSCVTDFETESRTSGNETPMRPDSTPQVLHAPDPATIAQIASNNGLLSPFTPASRKPFSRHASSASRFIPSYETVSRVPGFEMDVRQTNPNLTPAPAPDDETESRSSGNETTMRLDEAASTPAFVSDFETESRSSGNETTMRLADSASTPASVSDIATESRSSGNETSMGLADWASTPASVSDIATESRSSGNETPMRLDDAAPTPAIVSDIETKSRSSGNETAARLASPARFGTAAQNNPPTVASASLSETQSRSSGNETEMRRPDPA